MANLSEDSKYEVQKMLGVQERFDLSYSLLSSVAGSSDAGAAQADVSCIRVVPDTVSSQALPVMKDQQ